ncbi:MULTISPECIES: hypothetical protein [Pandoraea]|uniref:Uncharacterized protein n=2 Tax=Pandoraea TaxID=93217 RepID=A0A5E4XFT6_9BURK|nr:MULTISPECIES: hypothetical protein [Pandoraea]ALS62011.1 hypothetical protein AT302_21705 [Pandoraea norimbergensis]VVE35187.1 hypothetical protein PIN31009_03837 [Pandoraea iniqua]VVE39403.1 hypothetical protein PIN31115_04057 [Pandoraea iniqua]
MLTLSKQAIVAAIQRISDTGQTRPSEAVINALLARELICRVGERLELTQFGRSYCRSERAPAWR